MATTAEGQLPPLSGLLASSSRRTAAIFASSFAPSLSDELSSRAKLAVKISNEYEAVRELPIGMREQQGPHAPKQRKAIEGPPPETTRLIEAAAGTTAPQAALTLAPTSNQTPLHRALSLRKQQREVKPDYHPQWRLSRVISGHLGWVRSVAVEPGNKWFATGAGDRVIKIWDLASGELKISLTGHISTVRGLAVSPRHPYLFSCGEDKMVKCWDLEANKVIRHYHGHLSGIYALALHPTLDLLVTSGRDASARVWDMRTKAQIHVLAGHSATVGALLTAPVDPQVITGSMDSTIRLWDITAGKTMMTLTHHKKSVRALALSPSEFSFVSGSAGGNNIKKFKLPGGELVYTCKGHEAIINCMSVNGDGVQFSGGDNGSLTFWDYKTGLPFQHMDDIPQPGSLDAEAGVFCSTFDMTGTRLITGGADKTIKIYAERTE
ncbi:pre-mRNA-splicing factor PRP46 [Dacryopinax primogenitus]|uniref:Pre-mRNA-splicing factor PRP46 n=1 Tax=Dacryopinax primogenitus (strain DJM 731) TaxID=1858805 RepID=M5FRE0_DACPD|nr:pre-mRNA-splicing factor PRP46 [Dacryopinax primogenitus]EJT98208.1 pre-mRNA-splicing factor PRP46 [Dacryopinax primogenitus]